eukprot:sb/3478852/
MEEINEIRSSAADKEIKIKDAEGRIESLVQEVESAAKTAQNNTEATNILKRNIKKMKKHLKAEYEKEAELMKQLAEQSAIAQTLELDLQAQKNVSYS